MSRNAAAVEKTLRGEMRVLRRDIARLKARFKVFTQQHMLKPIISKLPRNND